MSSIISNSSSIISSNDVPWNLASGHYSTVETIFLLSYVIPLIIFTVVSNSFVIYVIMTYPPLKNPSNLLLLSLAMTDFFNAIFVMPVACYYNIVAVWYLGPIGCKIWTFLSFFLCGSSIFHLCAIAIDRYRAITKPLTYATKRSNKKSLIIIAIVWTFSFIITAPPFFIEWGMKWPEVFYDDTPCTLPQSPSYAIYSSFGSYYLPMLLIVGIYINLYLINRARFKKKIEKAAQMIEMTGSSNRNSEQHFQAKALVKQEGFETDARKRNVTADSIIILQENTNSSTTDQSIAVSNTNEPRLVRMIAKGSKRRHILSKVNGDFSQKIIKLSTRKCQNCGAGISKSLKSNICQICSSPNDLLLAAEKSRLAILVQKERRSMFIMSIIVCTFIICWTPGFTIFLTMAVFPSVRINSWIITIAWWLCYSNSACNPIIYTIFNRDFNDVFYKMFR